MTPRGRNMLIAVAVLAVALLALGYALYPSGRSSSAQAREMSAVVPVEVNPTTPEPSPSPAASKRKTASPRVQYAGARDPFAPVVKPTAETDSSSNQSSDQPASSNPPAAKTHTLKHDSKASGTQSGASSKSSSPSKASKKGPSKDAPAKDLAPKPIGGDTPREGSDQKTQITVLEVGQSRAVVRVGADRAVLYLNVPDPSGVMYVSPLGSGCGWFTQTGSEDRVTICKGETRRLGSVVTR